MIGAIRTGLIVALALASIGCGGGGSSPPPPPPPPPPPQSPTFTSPPTVSVLENFTDVVYRPVATDPQNDSLTYTMGGPDAALFSTNSVTREIRFILPPDREQPGDVGFNNVYDISFTASDGVNATTLNVAITVTDVQSGFRVRRIPTDTLGAPVAGYPDASGRFVLIHHTGVMQLHDGAGAFTSMGDLSTTPFFQVNNVFVLDIAFSPNFVVDGLFYLWTLDRNRSVIEIVKFRMSQTTANRIDLSSGDVILRAPMAFQFNTGGLLAFDDVGLLYVGIGSGDGDAQAALAQDPASTYGKILRIDPSTDAFPGDADRDYTIPAANPFASGGGLPEVYALGVARPRHGEFTSGPRSIVFSDQGSFTDSAFTLIQRQELNRLGTNATLGPPNFGWPLWAGTANRIAGTPPPHPGEPRPVAEYDQTTGTDIMGGVTYRGPIEDFQGDYFFGDGAGEKLWSVVRANIGFGSHATPANFLNYRGLLLPPLTSSDGPFAIDSDTRGNLLISATETINGLGNAGIYIVEPVP